MKLHARSTTDAAALELGRRKKVLDMDELPAELRGLRPAEVEDFLCISEDDLTRIDPPVSRPYGQDLACEDTPND